VVLSPPTSQKKYCAHPYADHCLTWVCEKQNKVQNDCLNSRTGYGLKLLHRLYLYSVKNTSTLTATLGHQTQQPRLHVSDRNADAHHIGQVCDTPTTEGSRVCAAATHFNQSQPLPHHRLWHDGGCVGRRAAATKKPQAKSHRGNEGDQKRLVAGRLGVKGRPVRTRSGAGPGGCADVGWRAAPATATTASSRTAPPGRSDTVGRRAAPATATAPAPAASGRAATRRCHRGS